MKSEKYYSELDSCSFKQFHCQNVRKAFLCPAGWGIKLTDPSNLKTVLRKIGGGIFTLPHHCCIYTTRIQWGTCRILICPTADLVSIQLESF